MCNFGVRSWWRSGIIFISYRLGVHTKKDQYRLLNPTPFGCITGYIMGCAVGDMVLNNMPRRSLNLIDGSISSCFYILNSPRFIDITKQEKRLEGVLGDIESYFLGSKEERKNRDMK